MKKNMLMMALVAVVIMFMVPRPIFGQGTTNNGTVDPQVNIYFAVAPIYDGSAKFFAWQKTYVESLQNTNQPLVPLISPGATLSVTNLFSFYPGNIGNELLAGVHVHVNGSTFSLNQITWILSSPTGTFTNVYTGISFGPGAVGANGSNIYTSGGADNVPLSDLWITPEGISYSVGQEKTMDQAIASFISANSPNFPVTVTCILNGTSNSGTVLAQARPVLNMGPADGNKIQLSWLNWSYSYAHVYTFVLEQNRNPNTTNWTAVTNAQNPIVGSYNSVTVTNAGGNMFFRLKY